MPRTFATLAAAAVLVTLSAAPTASAAPRPSSAPEPSPTGRTASDLRWAIPAGAAATGGIATVGSAPATVGTAGGAGSAGGGAAAGTTAGSSAGASAGAGVTVTGVEAADGSATGSDQHSRTPAVRKPAPSAAAVRRAHQQAADSRAILSGINALRAEHGLPPLRAAADLTAYARRHSVEMARPRRLVHSTGLGTLCCWKAMGENVAYATTAVLAHDALVGSAPHLANMLNAGYTEVGIGAVSNGGQVWVTEVFRTRA